MLRIPFQWEPATRIPSQMLMSRAFELEGVDHVMSVFMRHLTDAAPQAGGPAEPDADSGDMMALAEVACDEELLARK